MKTRGQTIRGLQERLIVERDRAEDRATRDRIAHEVNTLDLLLGAAKCPDCIDIGTQRGQYMDFICARCSPPTSTQKDD